LQCLGAIGFILGVILVAGALLWGAIALMRRGEHRGSGQLGSAMQNLEGLFVESKKHVVEAEQRDESQEDESGDPPAK
jgi:hypothetical protein